MQPTEGFKQETENMGQDAHRLGRRRGRDWNWNWNLEGGRSGGMEECKFVGEDWIMTAQCRVRGKSFILSMELRPEVPNVTLSFCPLRSSFHNLPHLSSHPPLFSYTTCVWTSSTLCSSSPELTSVNRHCVYCIFFFRQYGKLDRIPHGIYRRAGAYSLVATYLL